jgi:hypothetical protein
MKKSLEQYALIAEIVGAIAVILSLLYVGFQIQLNTAERRADSVQSITTGNRDLALVYVNNHQAGVAWHKVLDGVALNKRELEIMSDVLYAHLMVLEETYSKHQEGYLDDAFLNARVALIQSKILWSPQLREVYALMKQVGIYSKPFIEWLDIKLRESEWYENGRPSAAPSSP